MSQKSRFIYLVLLCFCTFIAGAQQEDISYDIYFSKKSSTLSKTALHTLDSIFSKKLIKRDQYILLYGYADVFGTKQEGKKLSNERAQGVKSYLSKKGIPLDNILIMTGLGQLDTVSGTEYDEDDFSYFRKVEIVVSPQMKMKKNTKFFQESVSKKFELKPELNSEHSDLKEKTTKKPITTDALLKCKASEKSDLGSVKEITKKNDTLIKTDINEKVATKLKKISVTFDNGDKFAGLVNKDGIKNNKGIYEWEDGDKYEGNYKNDKRNGFGVYTWSTGEVFEGLWVNDIAKMGRLTENAHIKFLLNISTNLDSRLFIEGEEIGDISENEIKKIYLPKGKLNLKFIALEDTNRVFSTDYTADETKREDSLVVDMKYFTLDSFVKILTSDTANDMAFVEGGAFLMGNKLGNEDARTVHNVKVSHFYFCKHDVTVGEFRKFVNATNYVTTAEKIGWSWVNDPTKNDVGKDKILRRQNSVTWEYDEYGRKWKTNEDKMPVLHVSWVDAEKYCKWLSSETGKEYRLPSEAEWEYAAKNGKKNKYTLNASIKTTAGFGENDATSEMIAEPNLLGLYGLTGKLWEWCLDWYDKYYYTYSPESDPKGAKLGISRVLRGGAYSECNGIDIFTCRYLNYPSEHGGYISFRVVRSLK